MVGTRARAVQRSNGRPGATPGAIPAPLLCGRSAHGRASSRWRVRALFAAACGACWQRRSCQARSGDSCPHDTALRCQLTLIIVERAVASETPSHTFSCHRAHADAFPVSRRPTGCPPPVSSTTATVAAPTLIATTTSSKSSMGHHSSAPGRISLTTARLGAGWGLIVQAFQGARLICHDPKAALAETRHCDTI